MAKTLGVTALQSSNTRKIDLYSKHWENKSQALTKTVISFDCKTVQAQNLHHCVCHKLRNGLLDNLFVLLPSFIANQDEIYEEKTIAYDRINVT